MADTERVRLGVSACLLGRNVRFDGGHRRSDLVERIAAFAELIPVCPEVELGLGVPREPVRLSRVPGQSEPALVHTRSGDDLSDRMRRFARARAQELARQALDGFLLQGGSPSCGMERVRVYRAEGPPDRDGVGLFAAALARACPTLPIEEAGRLHDRALRDSFLARVFVHHRLSRRLPPLPSIAQLLGMHAELELLVMAHHPESYRRLGALLASGRRMDRAALRERYLAILLAALAIPSTRARQVQVLAHAAGYLRTQLSSDDLRELQELIADYARGLEPRAAPLTLLRHHLGRVRIAHLQSQTYWHPYPRWGQVLPRKS